MVTTIRTGDRQLALRVALGGLLASLFFVSLLAAPKHPLLPPTSVAAAIPQDDPNDTAPKDLPLDSNTPTYGSTGREQLAWIWEQPGFAGVSRKMSVDFAKKNPHQEARFRRTITCPEGMENPEVVFCGDNQASLKVNGRNVGTNHTFQDVVRFPLRTRLQPGANQFEFTVTNDKGPAGLIARVEWHTASGEHTLYTTNDKWECSDDGRSWRKATVIALPVPAPTQFDWVYPHLEKLMYPLTYALPPGVSGGRIATRATNTVRVYADNKEVLLSLSAGNVVGGNFDIPAGAKQLKVVFEDICQPPAGQAALELKENGQYRRVALSDFRTADGSAPKPIETYYPNKTWPLNVGSFEAAATRPFPVRHSKLEGWGESLVNGGTPIFTLGTQDDSAKEFADVARGSGDVRLPNADVSQCPRGLDGRSRTSLNLHFSVNAIPTHGAAFLLNVLDADANATSVGVFLNGILCGIPQVIGYDPAPGGRTTNRYWIVTIPKERFQTGDNTLTLTLLPPYYQDDSRREAGQGEEFLQANSSGPRSTLGWLNWDCLSLVALAHPAAEPINGRPVWLGTNLGYIHLGDGVDWRDFVQRDLDYMGMAYAQSPIRFPVWNSSQYGKLKQAAPSGTFGSDVGEYELSSLVTHGMRPFFLFSPGDKCDTWEQFNRSREVDIVKRYGKYVDMLEIGNEGDNPYYGWDARKMALGYANIIREATCGQALEKVDPNHHLQITGPGWYHAWDYSVIDSQARKEAPNDPGYTDFYSTHNYAKSFLVSATTYYMLYGSISPKPIWSTECGANTSDNTHIDAFDTNLRGNLAFSTYIVPYLLYPYSKNMERFAMLGAQAKDAPVLEKARCYRRLIHAYAQHGTPLAWNYRDPRGMHDHLVMVNPVDAGKAYKISFVNFSHDRENVDVSVTLPASGDLKAMRYADGQTVQDGSREVTVKASPVAHFTESLSPGETVEYLVPKNR